MKPLVLASLQNSGGKNVKKVQIDQQSQHYISTIIAQCLSKIRTHHLPDKLRIILHLKLLKSVKGGITSTDKGIHIILSRNQSKSLKFCQRSREYFIFLYQEIAANQNYSNCTFYNSITLKVKFKLFFFLKKVCFIKIIELD